MRQHTVKMISTFLQDAYHVAFLYSVFTTAGKRTSQQTEVTQQRKNLLTVPMGHPLEIVPYQQGKTTVYKTVRPTRGLQHECYHATSPITIEYCPEDITIVGGAVLRMYDHLNEPFRSRHGIPSSGMYMEKGTSDLDMVWWPRIHQEEKKGIMAKSSAILIVIQYYTYHIKQVSIDMDLHTYFQESLGETYRSYQIQIHPYLDIGLFSVELHVLMGEEVVKLAELKIHDGCASQQVDYHGVPYSTLQPMNNDLLYVSPLEHVKGEVGGIWFNVPPVYLYAVQQLYAVGNQWKRGNREKAYTHYKRVSYLYKWIYCYYLQSTLQAPIESIETLKGLFPHWKQVVTKIKESMESKWKPIHPYLTEEEQKQWKKDNEVLFWTAPPLSLPYLVQEQIEGLLKAPIQPKERILFQLENSTFEFAHLSLQEVCDRVGLTSLYSLCHLICKWWIRCRTIKEIRYTISTRYAFHEYCSLTTSIRARLHVIHRRMVKSPSAIVKDKEVIEIRDQNLHRLRQTVQSCHQALEKDSQQDPYLQKQHRYIEERVEQFISTMGA